MQTNVGKNGNINQHKETPRKQEIEFRKNVERKTQTAGEAASVSK